jgi:hypothetical protein
MNLATHRTHGESFSSKIFHQNKIHTIFSLGDSGGPVQYKLKYTRKYKNYTESLLKTVYEIPAVLGLVSFGVGCGFDFPSVNTRVANYVEWLESEMNKHYN